LKILFRTNEPRAAKWVSDLIGDVEREKERISTNAAVNDNRDSIHHSTYLDQRPVISKEEIMGLPNLCGYWKYESEVVGFRFPYNLSRQVAEGFRLRETKRIQPVEKKDGDVQPAPTGKPRNVRKLTVPDPQSKGGPRVAIAEPSHVAGQETDEWT